MSERFGDMVRVQLEPRRDGHEDCFTVTVHEDSVISSGLSLCRHEATRLLDQLAAALEAGKETP